MESDSATLTQQPATYESTTATNESLQAEESSNPMEEIDEDVTKPASPVAPSNTPITGDSGQTSSVPEVSSDGTSDDGQKEQGSVEAVSGGGDGQEALPATKVATTNGQAPAATTKPQANGAAPKESRRADDKKNGSVASNKSSKKKEEKGGIDSILRALNSLESPEEKLAAICKKYADLHEEHRVLQSSFKTQQRSISALMKERDQVSSEHAKAIIAKSRLESLCRELQKHNKLVKEESIQRAKEDDEKRKELSAKFQTTIGEIQTQMNSNNERNSKLQEENLSLAKQLKQFVEQYEVREQKVRQHRDLEQQVSEAKLAKASAILKEEQERNMREKEILLTKIGESNKKVNLLETQVRVFKERYDEFESLHTRSNETFQKYKTEMDKMGKRIKKLEKDGLAWKSKYEKSNKAHIESIDARSKSEKETASWVQKTKTLESLCRALQEKLHEKPSAPQAEVSDKQQEAESPTGGNVPPNSPEVTTSSSGQASPDSSVVSGVPPVQESPAAGNPPLPTSTTSPSPSPIVTESQNDEGKPSASEEASDSSPPTTTTEVSSSSSSQPSAAAAVPSSVDSQKPQEEAPPAADS